MTQKKTAENENVSGVPEQAEAEEGSLTLHALVDFMEESLPGLKYTSARPIHFTHPAMGTLRQIAQLATVLVTAGDLTS